MGTSGALAVLVDRAVAVVVASVAGFRGNGTTLTARVQQELVDAAVAVVVDSVAEFGRRHVLRIGLARAVARAVREAEHLPRAAHEIRNDAGHRVGGRTARAEFVHPAVAVVVDAVRAALIRRFEPQRNAGSVIGPVGQAGPHALGANAVHPRVARSGFIAFARPTDAFVRLAVAVVVGAVADLGREIGAGQVTHADPSRLVAGLPGRTVPAGDVTTPLVARPPRFAVGFRGARLGFLRAVAPEYGLLLVAAEAAGAKHHHGAQRHDPVRHPVLLHRVHLPSLLVRRRRTRPSAAKNETTSSISNPRARGTQPRAPNQPCQGEITKISIVNEPQF